MRERRFRSWAQTARNLVEVQSQQGSPGTCTSESPSQSFSLDSESSMTSPTSSPTRPCKHSSASAPPPSPPSPPLAQFIPYGSTGRDISLASIDRVIPPQQLSVLTGPLLPLLAQSETEASYEPLVLQIESQESHESRLHSDSPSRCFDNSARTVARRSATPRQPIYRLLFRI